MYRYLSEHHSFGQTDEQARKCGEDMAAEMLATILDIDFEADEGGDERREFWPPSDQIVRTTNVAQSARGGKDGSRTSVVAAACVPVHG
jgi:arginine decarboxylase